MKQKLMWGGVVILVLAVAIQLVPLNRTNPAVVREVKWDTPETRALAQRACFDCHSNETTWPWYSYMAPVSFVVANHVREGRDQLNFSDWTKPNADIREVERNITRGSMPSWDYLLMHANAKLTAAEQQQLIAGLKATFQQDPPIARPRGFGGQP